MIHQKDAIHEHQQVLKRVHESESTLDGLRSQGARFKPAERKQRQQSEGEKFEPGQEMYSSSKTGNWKQSKQCMRCGKEQHSWCSCPAIDVTCYRCNCKGHFGSQCRFRTVSEVQEESILDTAFIDALSQTTAESWRVKLRVSGQVMEFKVDTGAEVTAISETAFRAMRKQTLKTPTKNLYGPAHSALHVLDQFEGELSHQGKTTKQNIYVIKGLRSDLLGFPAIMALELMARVGEAVVNTEKVDIVARYPKLFQGLGNLGEPYDIQLKPDPQPHALFTARNIPLPLRGKVQQELDRMESLGIISRVDAPTSWCAGMVVASKKNGDIRIYVDFQPLNR